MSMTEKVVYGLLKEKDCYTIKEMALTVSKFDTIGSELLYEKSNVCLLGQYPYIAPQSR